MTIRRIGMECCACGQLFTSDSPFRKHRVGLYGEPIYDSKKQVDGYTKHTRTCLTEVEMLEKGMMKNEKGLWTTGEFDASAFAKEA